MKIELSPQETTRQKEGKEDVREKEATYGIAADVITVQSHLRMGLFIDLTWGAWAC